MTTLEYHFDGGSHVIFEKYTIDTTGVVRNKKGHVMAYRKKEGYNAVTVYDDSGKRRNIQIGRALASTFHENPPTSKHTADHKDRNRDNDTLENVRWLDKFGQISNQIRAETLKSAFIIVKDEVEKTVKQWVEYLEDETNHMGRKYTESMIVKYAVKTKHGFSYKVYPDIPGEIWKEVVNSKTNKGHWEISNMSRVKHVTKNAKNVLYGERLGLSSGGYPRININGKHCLCHLLAFESFFPFEYASKKSNEIILHQNDNKMDFRPHTLRIGTRPENGLDAHNNGKHYDTKTERNKCASYINNVFEKEHLSQRDAARYLISEGLDKATHGEISKALDAYKEGKIITRYGRTWKNI